MMITIHMALTHTVAVLNKPTHANDLDISLQIMGKARPAITRENVRFDFERNCMFRCSPGTGVSFSVCVKHYVGPLAHALLFPNLEVLVITSGTQDSSACFKRVLARTWRTLRHVQFMDGAFIAAFGTMCGPLPEAPMCQPALKVGCIWWCMHV